MLSMKNTHKNSRKFSLMYHQSLIAKAAFSFAENRYLKKYKLMNLPWKERIMLAVTEVNQCGMCSWMHTNISLKAGMSQEEISTLLSGTYDHVPEKQLLSVLYAQNFAANKEQYNPKMKQAMLETYGKPRTRMIENAMNVITMTNSMGIALGKLKETLTFNHVKGSSVLSEILIPLSTMILFPVFVIIALLFTPIKVQTKRFKKLYL
jgi:AhpD family alkylhydroperoxidase